MSKKIDFLKIESKTRRRDQDEGQNNTNYPSEPHYKQTQLTQFSAH